MLAIVIAIAWGLPSLVAQTPSSTPSVISEHKQDVNEPADHQNNSSPQVAAKNGNKKSKAGTENYKKHTDRWEKLVAKATVWIATFTVLLFVATILLWWGAEKHSERALRAYIFVSECYIEPLTINGPIQATVTVENGGQTPAYKISARCGVWIDEPKSKEFTVRKTVPSVSSLGPEGQTDFTPESAMVINWNGECEEIGCGEKAIFVGTEIEYWDIFGKQRMTQHKAFFLNNDVEFLLDSRMLPEQSEDHNDST
jgi:hypothetical protein